MKKYDNFHIEEINDLFDDIDDFDFIATAISGWHLCVVYSYLLSLDRKLKGIILINANRISEERIMHIEGINIFYVSVKEITYNKKIENLKFVLFSKNNMNGKDFWVLSPFGYNLSLFTALKNQYMNKKIHLVKFDEGIGSYLTESDFNMFANENSKRKNIVRVKIIIKLAIKNFVLHRLKCNMYDFNDFFLFEKGNGRLIENHNVIKYFRKFYIESANYDLNYKKNQILIFKDFDFDRISTEDVIEFYSRLIESLGRFNKIIYLKKHPYDNELKFNEAMASYKNVRIINNSLDAEMIFTFLDPMVTIGGVSTCCFSIPVIFNRKTYNFSELYNNYNIAPILKKEVELRKKYFPNDRRIVFLDSFDSIYSLLSRNEKPEEK